jgi:hypothetical protein
MVSTHLHLGGYDSIMLSAMMADKRPGAHSWSYPRHSAELMTSTTSKTCTATCEANCFPPLLHATPGFDATGNRHMLHARNGSFVIGLALPPSSCMPRH